MKAVAVSVRTDPLIFIVVKFGVERSTSRSGRFIPLCIGKRAVLNGRAVWACWRKKKLLTATGNKTDITSLKSNIA